MWIVAFGSGTCGDAKTKSNVFLVSFYGILSHWFFNFMRKSQHLNKITCVVIYQQQPYYTCTTKFVCKQEIFTKYKAICCGLAFHLLNVSPLDVHGKTTEKMMGKTRKHWKTKFHIRFTFSLCIQHSMFISMLFTQSAFSNCIAFCLVFVYAFPFYRNRETIILRSFILFKKKIEWKAIKELKTEGNIIVLNVSAYRRKVDTR